MQGWLAKRGAEELAEITAPFFPQIERNILVSSLRRYAEAGIWARTPDVSRQGFARLGRFRSQADLSLACLFMKTASIRA